MSAPSAYHPYAASPAMYQVPQQQHQYHYQGYPYNQPNGGQYPQQQQQPIYMTPNLHINGNGVVAQAKYGVPQMPNDKMNGTLKGSRGGNTVKYTDWFGSVATRRPVARPGIPSFAPVQQSGYQTAGQESVAQVVPQPAQLVAIAIPPGLCACPTSSSGTTRAKRKKKCKICGQKTINIRHTLTAGHSNYRPALTTTVYASPAHPNPGVVAMPASVNQVSSSWDWGPYAVPQSGSGLPPPTGPPPPVPTQHSPLLSTSEEDDDGEESNPPTPETVRSVKSSDSTVTLTRELPEMIPNNKRYQKYQSYTSDCGKKTKSIIPDDNVPSAYSLMKPSHLNSVSSDTDDLSDNAVYDPLSDTLSSSPERSNHDDTAHKSAAFKRFQASRNRGRRVSVISVGEESDSASSNIIQISTSSPTETNEPARQKMNNLRSKVKNSHKILISDMNSKVIVNNLHSSSEEDFDASIQREVLSSNEMNSNLKLSSNSDEYDRKKNNVLEILNSSVSSASTSNLASERQRTKVSLNRSDSISSVKISGEKLVLINTGSDHFQSAESDANCTTSSQIEPDIHSNSHEVMNLIDFSSISSNNVEDANQNLNKVDLDSFEPLLSMASSSEQSFKSNSRSSRMYHQPEIIYEEEEDLDKTIEAEESNTGEEPLSQNNEKSYSIFNEGLVENKKSKSDNMRYQPSLSELLQVKSILKRPNSNDTSSENDSDFCLTPVTETKNQNHMEAKQRKSVQFSASDDITLVEPSTERRKRKKPSSSKAIKHINDLENEESILESSNSGFINDLTDVYMRTSNPEQNDSSSDLEVGGNSYPPISGKQFVPASLRANGRKVVKNPNHRLPSSSIPVTDMSIRSGYSSKDFISKNGHRIPRQKSCENLLDKNKYQDDKAKEHPDSRPNLMSSRYDYNWETVFEHSKGESNQSLTSNKNQKNGFLRTNFTNSKLPSPIRSTDAKTIKLFEPDQTPETSPGKAFYSLSGL